MRLKAAATAVFAALVLVMATDYIATAATGHSLVLGKLNKANRITTIERTTNGPAAQIRTNNSAAAPFATNARGRVRNLNADKVDGFSAGAFLSPGYAYSADGATNVDPLIVSFPGLPRGLYHASYSIAATMSEDASVNCSFRGADDGRITARAYGGRSNGFSATSGSSIIDTRDEAVILYCFTSAGTFSTSDDNLQADFVRISSVSRAEATDESPMPLRVAPQGNAGGADR